jgi:hypothetical protein
MSQPPVIAAQVDAVRAIELRPSSPGQWAVALHVADVVPDHSRWVFIAFEADSGALREVSFATEGALSDSLLALRPGELVGVAPTEAAAILAGEIFRGRYTRRAMR